ncbi:hypothetical protein [Actinomadura montaniterrae]|uniref:Uncharacterized protein n=1 Tax=Actinomadura montaniterrae TaxID=1803903 RepID=A0A6L3VWD7_9ACTN|nr:hypothetical protein [Actinomadura montaniterrae]KAB2380749.1 hypothetical protein F9B16_17190 [Actinomadura montaniterrae]
MNRGGRAAFGGKLGGKLTIGKPSRAQLGLIAVVFVLLVAGGEVLALKMGAFNVPLGSDAHPAVADHPKH